MLTFSQFIAEEHIPVKIKQHPKNPDAYLAYHGRKRVGAAITWNDLHHGKFGIYKSETHPDYRKKGVMSQLYHHIEKTTGKQLHPSSALSDDGHKFWQHYRPEAVKDDLRNHTDKLMGKDVHHPTHGPAKIDSVGSGGVMGRMPSGNTYFLKKDHPEVTKHLTESWQPEKAIRGWMSPSGNAHLFGHYDEHKDNHHPEYLKAGGKQGDSVEHAQKKGFVRFGGNVSSIHGFHHFVHYDATHPKGKSTALKALHYMKPEHNDEVTLSGSAGVYKKPKNGGKMYRNARAMKELGHEGIMPASQAYKKLHQ